MVAGHLQEKNEQFYAVLSYKDNTVKILMSQGPSQD